MARKSKGFGELLHLHQQTKIRQESMNRLTERVQQDFEGKVEVLPQSKIRIADILKEFVAPYLHTADAPDRRRILLLIAVFAWNVALRPQDQQPQEIEEFVGKLISAENHQAKQDITAILEEMVQRKRSSFAHIQQYIVDFELRETRNNFHLSVVSAPATEDGQSL